MTFLKIFLSAGILGPIVTQITAFFPFLLFLGFYYLGFGEGNTIASFLFISNLFIQALAEESVKYFSAIFWWKKYHESVTKKLLLYIIAGAAGLAVFEKLLVVVLKIKDGSLEDIPMMATASLFLEAILLHSIIAMLLYPFIKMAEIKKNQLYLYMGVIIISSIHALYNYYIIMI